MTGQFKAIEEKWSMGLGLDAGIYEDKETRDKKTRRLGLKRQGDWETRRQGDKQIYPRFSVLVSA